MGSRSHTGHVHVADTLEAIRMYSDDTPLDEQVKDYMTLAHIPLQASRNSKADTD